MNQALQEHGTEYRQMYPDAIEDPAKASEVAYASKGEEEVVVDALGKALEAKGKISTGDYHSRPHRDAAEEASYQMGRASDARTQADMKATIAADAYDAAKENL